MDLYRINGTVILTYVLEGTASHSAHFIKEF